MSILKKLLYSATSKDGKDESSFIEARDTREALSILEYKGYTDVRFHTDALTGVKSRPELEDLAESELSAAANFEIQIHKGANAWQFILECLRANRYIIIGSLLLFAWGLYAKNPYCIYGGLVGTVIFPVFTLWLYRLPRRYDRLLKAFSYGNTDEALKLIKTLRTSMNQDDMLFDLDIRKAHLLINESNCQEIYDTLKPWHRSFAATPGLFESRVSAIFYSANRMDLYLKSMRLAYKKSPKDATIIADLALAEARYGKLENAEILLKKIRIEEMTVMGPAFIAWISGLIAKRKKHNRLAQETLFEAFNALSEYQNNPASWVCLALMLGDLARCQHNTQIDAFAASSLENLWPILKAHAAEDVKQELQNLYPQQTSS